MAYSMEFKRAVAACAVTQLIEGRHDLDAAVRLVFEHVGDVVFVTLEGDRKVKALLDYRQRLLSLGRPSNAPPRLSIARYHYDSCMKWIEAERLKPERSAYLLMHALLDDSR